MRETNTNATPAKPFDMERSTGVAPVVHGRDAHATRLRARAGFSLIEMLTVAAIIAILMGMIAAAASAARQRAYHAQAQTEVRELAGAMRAYWLTYGYWPPEVQGLTDPDSFEGMNRKYLASLIADPSMATGGNGWNTRKVVFLQLPDKGFGFDNSGRNDMYLDPWGNAYEMAFDKRAEVKRSSRFVTKVTFPMRNRYKYP